MLNIRSGTRVFQYNGGTCVIGKGRTISCLCLSDNSILESYSIPCGFFKRFILISPLLSRLFRLAIHHVLSLESGGFVVFFDKDTYFCKDGNVSNIGKIVGSRPLVVSCVGDRVIYGEYRNNQERSPVGIYGWSPGQHWSKLCEFSDVRHIHSVSWDKYSNRFWITTGDSDSESGIWCVDTQFKSFFSIRSGSQSFRVVQLLFSRDFVYFGSDSPDIVNHIYRFSRETGNVEKLCKVGGPVFFGARTRSGFYFSTAVEPSINFDISRSELWFSPDGKNWKLHSSFEKDGYSQKFFQYGQIFFSVSPSSVGTFMFPFAVKGDGSIFIE